MENAFKPVLARLGERLRHLRGGISQEDAAKKSGVSLVYITRLENGRVNPSVKILFKLATAYGSTLGEIFEPWLRTRPLPVTGGDELLFDKLRSLLASGTRFREAIEVNVNAVYGLWERESKKSRQ